MSTFLLYLILKLDIIVGLFAICAMISGMAALIGTLGIIINNSPEGMEEWKNWFKRTFAHWTVKVVFVISLLLAILLPSTKDGVVLYIIPKIANNEKIQSITSDTLDILQNKTKEWLDTVVIKEKSK